jgi:hypothetical protein
MDFNFESVRNEQLNKLEKRMKSLVKSYLNDYLTAMGVINSQFANDNFIEWKKLIEDRMNDEASMTVAKWTISLQSVEDTLRKFLQ